MQPLAEISQPGRADQALRARRQRDRGLLEERRLAGAGLDVFEQEPLFHPSLRELRQVVLLPHLGSATLATRVRMGMICLENIAAACAGKPAPNQVNQIAQGDGRSGLTA